MAVAARTNDSALFELKSASLSALAMLLKTADLAALASAMTAQFGQTPAAFDHDPVIVDLGGLGADADALDFAALAALLRQQRLLPAAVRGGSTVQMQAALAAGLGAAPDAPLPAMDSRPRRLLPAAAAAAAVATATANATASESTPATATATEPAPAPAPATAIEPVAAQSAPTTPEPIVAAEPALPVATLTIAGPLRSGQQVYAKGGDLIVLAAVNFGAEVLADGNIHVYGPLRGKAVAGVRGNRDARIFSICMEPELVAIAGTYRTAENPLPAEVLGQAAQIRLDGDRLVFEPL